ncbi:hypothetical protein D3C81_2305550 [compost metagenome]
MPTQNNGPLGQRFIYQLFGTTGHLFRNHRAYIRCSLVRITHHQCARQREFIVQDADGYLVRLVERLGERPAYSI